MLFIFAARWQGIAVNIFLLPFITRMVAWVVSPLERASPVALSDWLTVIITRKIFVSQNNVMREKVERDSRVAFWSGRGQVQCLTNAQPSSIHAGVGGHQRGHGNTIFFCNNCWRFTRLDQISFRC